jgi:hypothetical protein
MNKIISALLAGVFIATLSASVFAADEATPTAEVSPPVAEAPAAKKPMKMAHKAHKSHKAHKKAEVTPEAAPEAAK